MKFMNKLMLIVSMLLISCIIGGCSNDEFRGDSTSSDTEFMMDFTQLNGTREHSLYADAGCQIDVLIESEEGSIDVYVYDPDGEIIYQGNDASSGTFKLNILDEGTYNITVTGKKAVGKTSFLVSQI